MEIHDDTTAVEGIKGRPAYTRAWTKFRLFQENTVEFECRILTEQDKRAEQFLDRKISGKDRMLQSRGVPG